MDFVFALHYIRQLFSTLIVHLNLFQVFLFHITIVRVKFVNKGNPVKNGTVSNTAERPVGSRPLCEDRPNVVRQLYFSKIAVRSAIRSTLLTTGRLAAASEGRTSYIACKAIHEQEE